VNIICTEQNASPIGLTAKKCGTHISAMAPSRERYRREIGKICTIQR
jgi:hypothetical protein